METQDIKLDVTPKIIQSPYLSDKTGLDISFLDYSSMPTGTHKWYKTGRIVEEVKAKGYGTILFINPVVDKREDADGSGLDSVRLSCALKYPEAQVVGVVHDDRTLWKEPINSRVSGSSDLRQKINLGLDLNTFYDAKKLEGYFKDLIKGRVRVKDKDVFDFNVARNFLYSKGNPLNCVDGTNLGDIGDYGLSKDLVKKLGEFDYIVGSAGAGGRALNQIESVNNGKTKHILGIPEGHPLDPFHKYEKSTSPRVQTKFRGETHEIIKNAATNRDDVLFKSISLLFGGEQAKAIVDNAIGKDNLNMKTSSDGALGCAILRPENFTQEGLRVFNSHTASKGGFNYVYQNFIPKGSKVLFVNTGISNNLKIKNL